MNITSHTKNNIKIAEITSDTLIINSAEDGKDILGDIYYQGFDKVILYEENITPDFFDLKNGIAGEMLQKFSNYRVQLAIVGDFEKYTKKSICDFIRESNRNGHINFVASLEEALSKLS